MKDVLENEVIVTIEADLKGVTFDIPDATEHFIKKVKDGYIIVAPLIRLVLKKPTTKGT